jgi:hypothetical protein
MNFYSINKAFFQNISNFFNNKTKATNSIGPNNFAELLKQFDDPVKIKTQEDVIRDYTVLETMRLLELDMLKLEPSCMYRGIQRSKDNDGGLFIDFVPCVVRPEVVYCSYGKS